MPETKKKTTKKKSAPKKKVDSKIYLLTLLIGSDEYTAKGDTVREVFENLNLPKHAKTKGAVRLQCGSKVAETMILPVPLRRILGNRVAQDILFKKLVVKLK